MVMAMVMAILVSTVMAILLTMVQSTPAITNMKKHTQNPAPILPGT